ncbi:MAG: SMC-Scp complex subunit ScpB [Vicinamibacterales bacterium]
MGDVERDEETDVSTQRGRDAGQLDMSDAETHPGADLPGSPAAAGEPGAVTAAAEPQSLASADDQAAGTVSGSEGSGEPEGSDGSEIPVSVDLDAAPEDETTPLLRSAELKAIVEALIFASPEPLSLKAMGKLLDTEPREDVEAAVAELKADYERPGGLQLVEVAGGFQIVTRPDLHEWVRRLFHERSTQKLSVQALETLAVIAYRQPITAAEVAEIRGVNTSGVLNTLLERHLIKIVGRKAVVGRPFMYATTREFLIRFGLNDVADLPKVQDMVDALGLESPLLIERVTAEEQLPLDEPDTDDVDGPTDSGGSPVSSS